MKYSGLIHNQSSASSESFFIRDAKAWDQFVARIPKHRMQKKEPAPPSTDPLLKSCPVDFQHQFAVVSTSNDIYMDAIILDVDGPTIRIEERAQPGYGMGQKPYGVGLYHLWVLETTGCENP